MLQTSLPIFDYPLYHFFLSAHHPHLYTIDNSDQPFHNDLDHTPTCVSRDNHPSESSVTPDVKIESDEADDRFIIELASPPETRGRVGEVLALPSEVPLRATQASSEMRKMMGVFRLNPFAMHASSGETAVGTGWCAGEARPLEEEPLVFEFQLDIGVREEHRCTECDEEEEEEEELRRGPDVRWLDEYLGTSTSGSSRTGSMSLSPPGEWMYAAQNVYGRWK